MTTQRKLLLELVRQHGGHLDADELFRRAKRKYPRLSLSTVYRSLRLFKELGLVEELHFEDDHHHYEGKGGKEHYHIVCLGCGRIVEFTSPHIPLLKKQVGKEHNFDIRGAEVHLSGYCPNCRQLFSPKLMRKVSVSKNKED